jgi:nucleotide-binding universal stress UspA family protein
MEKSKSMFEVAAGETAARGESAAAKPKEILVPIDFSEPSVNALRYARALAAGEKAHVTLLNVVEEPGSFRVLDAVKRRRACYGQRAERLRGLAGRELGSQFAAGIVVREGKPSVEIARLANQRQVELIVVGRHQHHGLWQWFQGHTASNLCRKAPCPVLLIKSGQHLSQEGSQ